MPTPVNPPSNFRYDLSNGPSVPPPPPPPAPEEVVAYTQPIPPASAHPCTPPCKLGCRCGRSGPPRRARAAVRPKPVK